MQAGIAAATVANLARRVNTTRRKIIAVSDATPRLPRVGAVRTRISGVSYPGLIASIAGEGFAFADPSSCEDNSNGRKRERETEIKKAGQGESGNG